MAPCRCPESERRAQRCSECPVPRRKFMMMTAYTLLAVFTPACRPVGRVGSTVPSTRDQLRTKQEFAAGERMTCGPRAGFLFGRFCGLRWSYNEAKSQISTSEKGTSFQTIKEGLEREGIACEIRRLDPSGLILARRPMIVLLGRSSPGAKGSIGDFVILKAADQNGVSIINPTTGQYIEWPWRYFSDRWSGYALFRKSYVGPREWPVLALTLVAAVVCLRSWGGPRRPSRWTLPGLAVVGRGKKVLLSLKRSLDANQNGCRPAARMQFYSVLLWVLLVFLARSAGAADELRSGQRDGANAAVLLAALCGCDVRETLERDAALPRSRVHSLLDVQRRAAELSCPSTAVSLTYNELMAMRRPTVVLVRDKQRGDGYFCIVLSARNGAVTLLATGLVVVQELTEDDFRRYWTGHALVPMRFDATSQFELVCFCAAGAMFAGLRGFLSGPLAPA